MSVYTNCFNTTTHDNVFIQQKRKRNNYTSTHYFCLILNAKNKTQKFIDKHYKKKKKEIKKREQQ